MPDDWTPGQVKEHIEAVLSQQQRATEIAEREREKAAQALATSLARAIADGDAALREHIEQQVQQVRAALESARREAAFAQAASEKAIGKAESANEKRFESVNSFRGQLTDQASQLMPREVAEARFAKLDEHVAVLVTALAKLT